MTKSNFLTSHVICGHSVEWDIANMREPDKVRYHISDSIMIIDAYKVAALQHVDIAVDKGVSHTVVYLNSGIPLRIDRDAGMAVQAAMTSDEKINRKTLIILHRTIQICLIYLSIKHSFSPGLKRNLKAP